MMAFVCANLKDFIVSFLESCEKMADKFTASLDLSSKDPISESDVVGSLAGMLRVKM